MGDYETVKERKKRFYADYPDGCVHVELLSPPESALEFVAIRASIWRERQHMAEGHPPDSQGMSLSKAGGQGADRDAWMENCEESAVGRALDNLGYSGNNKASRDEMEKAQRHAEARQSTPEKPQDAPQSNGSSPSNLATDKQRKALYALSQQLAWDPDMVKAHMADKYGVASSKELTKQQASELIGELDALAKARTQDDEYTQEAFDEAFGGTG